MTDWPDEIWAVEIDHEFAPSGHYYLSQPDGGQLYVHGRIHTDQERYFRFMLDGLRDRLRDVARAWQEYKDANTTDDHYAAVQRLDALLREHAPQTQKSPASREASGE